MRIIVDRIEEDFAVCELPNGKMINVPSEIFENVHEGDVFNILLDIEKTEQRKDSAKSRLNALFSKNKL